MAYSPSTIRQIKEELAEKRTRAAQDAEDRKQRVAARIPRAGEIDRELSLTAPRIMQAALSGKGWEAEFEKVKAYTIRHQAPSLALQNQTRHDKTPRFISIHFSPTLFIITNSFAKGKYLKAKI